MAAPSPRTEEFLMQSGYRNHQQWYNDYDIIVISDDEEEEDMATEVSEHTPETKMIFGTQNRPILCARPKVPEALICVVKPTVRVDYGGDDTDDDSDSENGDLFAAIQDMELLADDADTYGYDDDDIADSEDEEEDEIDNEDVGDENYDPTGQWNMNNFLSDANNSRITRSRITAYSPSSPPHSDYDDDDDESLPEILLPDMIDTGFV